jgi:long-subunit fatty acid transport protein
MRPHRFLGSCAVTFAALLLARAASAGPTDTFGLGSRSTAMGGAVSANVSDMSANYYNPAGLAGAKALQFEIGYMRTFHYLKMNGRDNQVDPMRALVFGLVAPGEIASVPFAFGMALHLPDDRVFRVRSLDQEQPRWEMYDNRTQRIFLAVNLAIRPWKWLEIGGGVAFLSATRVRLDITGTIDLKTPADSKLRHEVDADLTAIRYPQAGIRILPNDQLRLAAVYRGQFQLDINIDAQLDVTADFAGLPVPFYTFITTRTINAFLPQQVVMGGSYDITPHATVNFDAVWINWAAYKSPVTLVTARTEITPPPGFPKTLLPDKPAPTVVIEPKFENRVVPRIGGEVRIPIGRASLGHELALRAGYFYEKSPVPPQGNGTNFVDANRHAFSAGAGIKLHALSRELPGDIRFDMHAMYSYLPERVTLKESPADLIGDYRVSGTIWSIGSTLTVSF